MLCLKYDWDAWKIPKIYLRYALDRPELCSRASLDMPNKYQRYLWDISKIFLIYGWEMPDCEKYAGNNP